MRALDNWCTGIPLNTYLLHRQVLRWVGHVARMPITRLPKIALFGWPEHMPKHKTGRYTFPMWIKWLLNKYEVSQH